MLGKAPLSLQISADHLSLQQRTRRLELRGNVVVGAAQLMRAEGRGEAPERPMSLRAKRLVVLLDREGAPRLLEAKGDVRLRVKGSSGAAERVTLRLKRGSRTLELAGGASLKLERGLRVQGARIAVELDTGRLQVARPKITMRAAGGGDG